MRGAGPAKAAKSAVNDVAAAATAASAICAALFCFSNAILTSPLHAQRLPSLRAGDRIRVVSQAVPQGEVEGRLVNVFRDTLSMVASDSIGFLAIHLSAVGRLEVSRGRSIAPVVGGAVLGGVVGALLGAVLPHTNDRCRAGFSDVEDCATEVPDVVIGALGGAIGAGVLARALTPQRWERIRPDLLFGVDFWPHDTKQIVLSVSVQF